MLSTILSLSDSRSSNVLSSVILPSSDRMVVWGRPNVSGVKARSGGHGQPAHLGQLGNGE